MRCTCMYITLRSRNFLSYRSGIRSKYLRVFMRQVKKGRSGRERLCEVSSKFCNASTGEYANRFLKFRIVDDAGILLQAEREREQVTGSRYYHISGIELFTLGGDATTANDYWVNQYYQFSGYAEGYGDSEKFPFRCDATGNAEAVRLDVKHTYYRTESSGLGANHQNQLDTVYFAVPKRLFDTYGKLQRIKAEWYEYKTKEIVVTSNALFITQYKTISARSFRAATEKLI